MSIARMFFCRCDLAVEVEAEIKYKLPPLPACKLHGVYLLSINNTVEKVLAVKALHTLRF